MCGCVCWHPGTHRLIEHLCLSVQLCQSWASDSRCLVSVCAVESIRGTLSCVKAWLVPVSCINQIPTDPSILVSVCAVVSIRGTLSLEDCVTDFMCEPVDLDDWIKEVDSSNQPTSFSQRVPDVKPASKTYLHYTFLLLSCRNFYWSIILGSPKSGSHAISHAQMCIV